ncbi:MAG: hypothetical protein RL254_1108 [Planctomycetota bacterium]
MVGALPRGDADTGGVEAAATSEATVIEHLKDLFWSSSSSTSWPGRVVTEIVPAGQR